MKAVLGSSWVGLGSAVKGACLQILGSVLVCELHVDFLLKSWGEQHLQQ